MTLVIGGALYFNPEKCCDIITSCFILHNICKRNNIAMVDEYVAEELEELRYVGAQANAAVAARDHMIQTFFA